MPSSLQIVNPDVQELLLLRTPLLAGSHFQFVAMVGV